MPKWQWRLSPKILSTKAKHYLAYIWWYGDDGCREWNYRQAKRFKVSISTVQRWQKKLKDLHLVYVNFPSTKHRTIYRRPYFSILVWYEQRGGVKSSLSRSKLTDINNAKHRNNHKTGYSYAASKSETPAGTAAAESDPSNAGGLCGSRVFEYELSQVEREAAEIQRQTNEADQRRKREYGLLRC
jgi:hypothetical protein